MIGILDCAWKATAVLSVAGLSALLLRRAAASVRHLVWVSAMAAVLAIPLVSLAVPAWKVPVWRSLAAVPDSVMFRADSAPGEAVSPAAAATPRVPARRTPDRRSVPLAAIWLAGAAAVLAHLAASQFAVSEVARGAKPARESVAALAETLSGELGIRSRVRVLETDAATTPMTWGILRPVILIPALALESDPARLRAILIHELAHIERADCLWQALGQLACALYWFNPLAWIAQREALKLRERAADDAVLRTGVRASEYAEYLVRLARTFTIPRLCGSLAIACPSNLEQRVRAILDPAVERRSARRVLVLSGLAAAAVVTLAVAAVRPVAAQDSGTFAGLDARAAQAARSFDFEQAESALLTALGARKAQSGENSVEYARGLANLGALYARWDRTQQATEYYTLALPMLEASLGPKAPELFEPLRFLAVEAHARKDWQRATELYERAIAIGKQPQATGAEAALALAELANVKLHSGDLSSASELIEQALGAAPANSLERANVLTAKAALLRSFGRDDEAEEVSRSAAQVHAAWAAAERPAAAPAQADGQTLYKVGLGISPPVPVEKKDPEYSSEARINHFQGTAVLSVVIDQDGRPRDIVMVRPVGMGLDQKAVEAVRQWRFEPGRKDGQPVAVLATIEVNFRLK
jgi:TonB family protein